MVFSEILPEDWSSVDIYGDSIIGKKEYRVVRLSLDLRC